MTTLAPGTSFAGRYEILGTLGTGAMGSVYRARHVELRKPVALKVAGSPLVLGHVADDGAARFDREARAIARLDHPSIVRVFDYGRTRRHRFIAMQLLEGPTLRHALDGGPLSESLALRLAGHLLSALVHAHARGVLHRDLKPENIILIGGATPEYRPQRAVMIDFGLAFVDDEAALTARGACVGSPSYLAPERLEGGPPDARADLYAVGAILYEMLAGARPFVGESIGEILLAARTQPVRPLRATRPELSRPLDAFVLRALAKDPGKRFATADDMLAALDEVRVQQQLANAAREDDARDAEASTMFSIPVSVSGPLRRAWSWLRYGRWRWRAS